MLNAVKLSILSLFIVVSSCASTVGKLGNQKNSNKNRRSEAKVSVAWQSEFEKLFATDKEGGKEAWGLFSYGGWADNGQVLVIAAKKDGVVKSFLVPVGGRVGKVKNISFASRDVKNFSAIMRGFAGASDLNNNVMDGIHYEYVHFVKDSSGKVTIANRVFMNNPGVGKKSAIHEQLVSAFTPFRK